jgi:hypothetical protein
MVELSTSFPRRWPSRECAVSPQHVKDDGDHEVGRVIENGCCALAATVEVLCQHGCRVRNCRYPKQQRKVQNHQGIVGAPDMGEQAVVVDPHDADKGEADDESDVRGPLSEELGRKVVLRRGHFDFQNQQGDGNRENPVREGFDPGGLLFHVQDENQVPYLRRAFLF